MSCRRCLMLGALLVQLLGARIATGIEASIQIKISSGSEALTEVYVALVAEDEPWSRPLKEYLGPADDGVRWTLPPGRYRWIAAAPGFWWERSAVFDLQAEAAPHHEEIVLRRLGRIRGKVLDATGNPLVGARVGDPRAFVLNPANRLNDRAEAFLRGNWETLTEADGGFELQALEGHLHSVLIESPGYEPGILDNQMLSPGQERIHELRLAQGASLEVSWTTEPANGLLQLKAKDRHFLAKIPMTDPECIWQRSIEGGKAEWRSLPAGNYELYWIGEESAGTPAQHLGSFNLEIGASLNQVIKLPARPPQPSAVPGEGPNDLGSPLTLRLDSEAPAAGSESLQARLWTTSGWRPIPGRLEQASGGLFLKLEAGSVTGARILVESANWVGATQELRGEAGASVPVTLFPRAEVAGELQAPVGDKLPRQGLLRAMDCPRPGEAHRELLELPVEIGVNGAWRASVPAGCSCLLLEPGEYASLAWHKTATQGGAIAELGKRRLIHGGGVLARLVDSLGQAVAGARVDVLSPPEADAWARSTLDEDHSVTLKKVTSSPDGWAELRFLPPGSYRLRALAEGSKIPVFTGIFPLAANQREIIDPWILPAPGSLVVELDGEKSASDDVLVMLESIERTPRIRLDQRPSRSGKVRFAEVPPGPWLVKVLYRSQGSRGELARKELRIQPAQETHQKIRLGTAEYQGQLETSEGPFRQAGQIELLPLEGGGSVVSAKIDPEGTFEVHLQKPGNFSARVLLPELKRRLTIQEVHFEDPEEVTKVLLPGGKIEGVVVAEDGEPRDQVPVVAQRFERSENSRPLLLSQAVESDELGRFQLDFLQNGKWTLTAQKRDGKSRPVEIILGEGEAKSGLVLRLEVQREIRGRVLFSSGQPASGARIVASAPVDGRLDIQESRTAPDGTFLFRVQNGAEQRATFVVQPPGAGTTLLRREAWGSELVLVVSNERGELRLPVAEHPESWSLEAEDGASIGWGWLQGDSQDFYALHLVPGIWTARRKGDDAAHPYRIEPGQVLTIAP